MEKFRTEGGAQKTSKTEEESKKLLASNWPIEKN
jgi:hypothetical protein